jgi:hypothetical protein
MDIWGNDFIFSTNGSNYSQYVGIAEMGRLGYTDNLPDPNQSSVSIVLSREATLRRASRNIERAGDNRCTVLVCGNWRAVRLTAMKLDPGKQVYAFHLILVESFDERCYIPSIIYCMAIPSRYNPEYIMGTHHQVRW